ncbi:MAG: HesB/IscA family protein [Acidiferrobacterales bacterium]
MAVTLTEAAAQHVRRSLAKRGRGAGLRVGVRATGCSGFMYTVDYVDDIESHDQVFETHGLKVVVDEKSLAYIDGTELDYGRDGLNEGFRFNNPRVAHSCGCGESFSI